MLTDLYKIIALYIVTSILLVGIVKFALSFSKRHISFIVTLKSLIYAAVMGNLISFIIYKIFVTPGIYWGDLPKSYNIVLVIVALLPIICVVAALIWTLKKQLNQRSI